MCREPFNFSSFHPLFLLSAPSSFHFGSALLDRAAVINMLNIKIGRWWWRQDTRAEAAALKIGHRGAPARQPVYSYSGENMSPENDDDEDVGGQKKQTGIRGPCPPSEGDGCVVFQPSFWWLSFQHPAKTAWLLKCLERVRYFYFSRVAPRRSHPFQTSNREFSGTQLIRLRVWLSILLASFN